MPLLKKKKFWKGECKNLRISIAFLLLIIKRVQGVERVGVPGGGGAALNGGTPPAASVPPPDRPDEPPRKRPKLPAVDDVAALRRHIIECELLRLKNLRER